MAVYKIYKYKSSAKRALKRLFNYGIYSNKGMTAKSGEVTGFIKEENNQYKLEVVSAYWSESILIDFINGREKL